MPQVLLAFVGGIDDVIVEAVQPETGYAERREQIPRLLRQERMVRRHRQCAAGAREREGLKAALVDQFVRPGAREQDVCKELDVWRNVVIHPGGEHLPIKRRLNL